MELINIAELKSHLSDVIAKVSEQGTPVVIGKYGKPVAKLIPFSGEEKNKREPGFGKYLLLSSATNLQQQVDQPLDPSALEDFYK